MPCTGACKAYQVHNQQRYDIARPSPSLRGYDRYWRAFVVAYRMGYDLNPNHESFADVIAKRNVCSVPNCYVTRGLQYDHITPISQGGARLDPANVQPLCARHHNIKTAGERTAKGIGGPKTS